MSQTASSLGQVSMRCPGCQARLRASRSLIGQLCTCPRCRYRVVVRLPLPSDSDILLVEPQDSFPRPRG